jgi:subtilisin family serine protease
MKAHILFVIAVGLSFTCPIVYGSFSPLDIDSLATGDLVINHRFLVEPSPGVDSAALDLALSGIGAKIEWSYKVINWYSVRFDSGYAEDLHDSLAALGAVSKVDYDMIISPNNYYPEEIDFSYQWPLDTWEGQTYDIDMPEAWTFTRGNPNAGIFILDSGYPDVGGIAHPDYDREGHIVAGPNFCLTELPPPHGGCYTNGYDVLGHAIIMAGIIGAEHDGEYLAGVCPESYLLCSNYMFEYAGHGWCGQVGGALTDLYRGLLFLPDWNQPRPNQRARIVNCSWSWHSEDDIESIDAVLSHLEENGILLVCSAGHNCFGTQILVDYPAYCARTHSNVLAVNAYERNGNYAEWSAYFHDQGDQSKLIGGPGGSTGPYRIQPGSWCINWPCYPNNPPIEFVDHVDVLVDFVQNTRIEQFFVFNGFHDPSHQETNLEDVFGGTSVACAHATGVAGLVWALNPDLTPAEVRQVLLDSAVPGDPHNGVGRLNALNAMFQTPGAKTLQFNLDLTREVSLVGDLIIPAGVELRFSEGAAINMESGTSITIENGGWVTCGAGGEPDIRFSPGAEIIIEDGGHFGVCQNSCLTIENGGSVVAEEGSNLWFAPGARIVVESGGRIEANGTSGNPVRFEAGGPNPEQAWSGIHIQSSSRENQFSHCIFNNASVAIRGLQDSWVNLSDCNFNSCGIAVASLNGSFINLTNCNAAASRYYGAIAASRGIVEMHGGMITTSQRAGMWSAGIASLRLDGVGLVGNGPGNVADRTLYHGGIRNSFGTVQMHCVSSSANNGPGVTSLGGFVDMAPSGKNTIAENLTVTGTRAQIFFCNTVPDLCNGRNKICAVGGDLIQNCDAIGNPVEVTNNYWCGNPAGRIPNHYVNNGNDNDQSTNRCSLNDFSACAASEAAYRFDQGWTEENLMQYVAAMADYDTVMTKYPYSKEAKLCPGRILFCEGMLNKDWQTQRTYFLAVADTNTDLDLKFSLRASAAWCLVEMDEFYLANQEFANLMNQADSDYKSQKVALDALLAELKQAPWDSMGQGKRGDSRADRLLSAVDRMEAVLNGRSASHPSPTVPTQYALFQNYPNPFNPTTEIRFDLPENSPVQLTIYNSLGQKVATLVDEVRVAGSYRALWDGKTAAGVNVASGVYIYQLKTGNFVEAKKMALIR